MRSLTLVEDIKPFMRGFNPAALGLKGKNEGDT
jgi:hypothetical protein